jgi:hypothetical protein
MMNPMEIAVTGLIATGLADLWQQMLSRVANLPIANWRLVGRWVGWMPRGVFRHRHIGDATIIRGEQEIGWVFHYCIGIVYAGLYLFIVDGLANAKSLLVNALLFGLVTVTAPFFLMQPALGLGVMARHAGNRLQILFVTVTTHMVFGIGLFIGFTAAVFMQSPD